MVKISKPTAHVWVDHGKYSVKVDLSDFLVETFQSDPKALKKIVLDGLKKERREQLKEIAELKEKQEKLKLIFEVINKITATEEFKKKITKYTPKERREIRRTIKGAVADVNSAVEWMEYELKEGASRLNELRKIIMLLEETDPDLIETDF